MMAIRGRSGEECQVADYIIDQLNRAGPGPRKFSIARDNAHKRSHIGGACGNLIVKIPASPGHTRAPRRLMMAHMDTVPICIGCKPVRRGGRIISADTSTGLGADDRSGCAALLLAATRIMTDKLPHPPLTFLWTVQEEVGLVGARNVAISKLGKPKLAFNIDGGSPTTLVIGATGAFRMMINIKGIAAHAGGHPEDGVSATAIASLAIAQLHRDGWHGRIKKGNRRGTSNVGFFNAGEATNVVTETAALRAEARSHDRTFRKRIVAAYKKAFDDAAKKVSNDDGRCGKVSIDIRHDYESFVIEKTQPCVAAAALAIERAGSKTTYRTVNGGLDANWMNDHGIPTVTYGIGQHNIHTVDEYLDIDQFHLGCRVVLNAAVGDCGVL